LTPVEDIPGRTLSGPFAEVDLVFSGWADFDTKLAERLQTRPARLVLAVAEPYPEKGVPPGMLSKWFAEAQASGGKVETRQYCDAARGDLRSWFAKLFRPSATANTLYKKRTADRDPGAFSNDVLCHIAPIGHGHINLRGVMTFELGHNRSALLGLPMADGRWPRSPEPEWLQKAEYLYKSMQYDFSPAQHIEITQLP
jgi:hypothetical protein